MKTTNRFKISVRDSRSKNFDNKTSRVELLPKAGHLFKQLNYIQTDKLPNRADDNKKITTNLLKPKHFPTANK